MASAMPAPAASATMAISRVGQKLDFFGVRSCPHDGQNWAFGSTGDWQLGQRFMGSVGWPPGSYSLIAGGTLEARGVTGNHPPRVIPRHPCLGSIAGMTTAKAPAPQQPPAGGLEG